MKHTPGPWEWRINLKSKVVSLVSVSGGHWVMGFARYGMGGAAPEFIGEDGLLSRAECFAKPVPGREHHSHWFQTLDNPNAKLIAAAPELLDALKEMGDWLAYGLSKPDGAEPTDGDLERCERIAAKARAAIAKATT
jgi:hypothetical protein